MKMLKPDSLIVLGIIAAVTVAALVTIFLPQSRELGRLQDEIASREASLATDAAKAAVLPAMLRQVRMMQAHYKNFDQKLPKQKDLGEFLTEVSKNMGSVGLSNQLIEPGGATRETLFHTMPIIMRFRGSYLSLADLLQRIDGMERLTRVRRMHIKTDPKSDELDIEVQMNIYFTES